MRQVRQLVSRKVELAERDQVANCIRDELEFIIPLKSVSFNDRGNKETAR
jgi:hypothetical protein